MSSPDQDGPSGEPSPPAAQGDAREKVATALVLGVRYLFLTRYSWLLGIVLIALAPVSLGLLPGMMANFFVLDLPQQVFHVSWVALWCAAAVMETLRVATLNAPYRFDDYRVAVRRFRQAWDREPSPRSAWYRRWDGWICFGFGLLTALAIWYVIVDACISSTAADPAPTWEAYVGSQAVAEAVRSRGWQEALHGLLTTMLILGSVNGAVILAREWSQGAVARMPETRLAGGLARSVGARAAAEVRRDPLRLRLREALHHLLGPGYFLRPETDESEPTPPLHLAPGHLGVLLYTAVFLTWYAVNYSSATGPRRCRPRSRRIRPCSMDSCRCS